MEGVRTSRAGLVENQRRDLSLVKMNASLYLSLIALGSPVLFMMESSTLCIQPALEQAVIRFNEFAPTLLTAS